MVHGVGLGGHVARSGESFHGNLLDCSNFNPDIELIIQGETRGSSFEEAPCIDGFEGSRVKNEPGNR